MRIEISNELNEISKVMSLVEKFSKLAELDLKIKQIAELALDELLTNIISYGYRDSNSHRITVEIEIDQQALQLIVIDDAIAFNPFEVKAPNLTSSLENRDLGGLGVHLIKNTMDDYSYKRSDNQNIVTLTKKIDS